MDPETFNFCFYLELVFPEGCYIEWKIYRVLFNLNRAWRARLALRKLIEYEKPFFNLGKYMMFWECTNIARFYHDTKYIASSAQLRAIARQNEKMILRPEILVRCVPALSKTWPQLVEEIANIALRNSITKESRKLLLHCLLCFVGKQMQILRKCSKIWASLRQHTKSTEWETLFYRRNPAQIIDALKTETWERVRNKRDTSPKRPQKVNSWK